MENRKMQTEYGFPCREAKPVWLPDGSQPNRYVQFLQKFTWDGDGALSLQLSCDSRARVCLNGERIGFAFYDGTDDTSWYETFDLSRRSGAKTRLRSRCGIRAYPATATRRGAHT